MSKVAIEKALFALEAEPYLSEWYLEEHVIPEAISALKEALKQEDTKAAWVSLTNEEQQKLYDKWEGDGWGSFYNSIEKALKEKNHV
jgi:hypothetical protein